jgi:hypothetical protein
MFEESLLVTVFVRAAYYVDHSLGPGSSLAVVVRRHVDVPLLAFDFSVKILLLHIHRRRYICHGRWRGT